MQEAKKFEGDLACLEGHIASLGSPAENISTLITKGVLYADMRIDKKDGRDSAVVAREERLFGLKKHWCG